MALSIPLALRCGDQLSPPTQVLSNLTNSSLSRCKLLYCICSWVMSISIGHHAISFRYIIILL